MPQPKLKESEIFATPLQDWTPEHVELLKATLRSRIAKLRASRNLATVEAARAALEAETKKPKKAKKAKKSLAEEVGI